MFLSIFCFCKSCNKICKLKRNEKIFCKGSKKLDERLEICSIIKAIGDEDNFELHFSSDEEVDKVANRFKNEILKMTKIQN